MPKLICVLALSLISLELNAQKQGFEYPDTAQASNMIAGELTPGKGFNIIKTNLGSLNLGIYALVRFLDQTPGNQVWYDHLGNKSLSGAMTLPGTGLCFGFRGCLTPKLTYTLYVWIIFSTQQTLVYGNLQYTFNKNFKLGVGVAPNLSVRSMQGPFPFYLSTDRTMGEEALRSGFTMGNS